MTEHLKKLAESIQLAQTDLVSDGVRRTGGTGLPFMGDLLISFVEELDTFKAADFEPAARYDFLLLRQRLRSNAKGNIGDGKAAAALTARMAVLLDSYRGDGKGAKTRSFAGMTKAALRDICERDYRELELRAFPGGAWKSSVILAGSILEGVLADLLTKDPAAVTAAMGHADAPKKKGGVVKDITSLNFEEQWSLNSFIKVACGLGLLPFKEEQSVHFPLRESRNFVHPRLEAQLKLPVSEGHATAAKGTLDVVLDHLGLV